MSEFQPPAFPEYENPAHGSDTLYPGMLLRDYFAARMMGYFLNQQTYPYREYNLQNAAMSAYKMADVMMKAREVQE